MQAWSAWMPQRLCFCSLLFLPNCWLTAVIHANSWAPSAFVSIAVLLASLLGWLIVPPVLTRWMFCAADMTAIAHHHGTHMGFHGARVACTLVLLVRLAKGSAPLVLCCPCVHCLGSEVWLATRLRSRWWLCWFHWLPLPWFVMPGPSVRSIHHEGRADPACFWPSDPFGPHRPFCFVDLLQDGER